MDQHSLHRGFSCVCKHAHDEVCSRRHVAASVSTCFKRNLGFKSHKEQLSCEKKTKGSC